MLSCCFVVVIVAVFVVIIVVVVGGGGGFCGGVGDVSDYVVVFAKHQYNTFTALYYHFEE